MKIKVTSKSLTIELIKEFNDMRNLHFNFFRILLCEIQKMKKGFEKEELVSFVHFSKEVHFCILIETKHKKFKFQKVSKDQLTT
jgi:hypothetical protein